MQATPALHLEIIFRIEAMAYKPVLQSAIEYKPAQNATVQHN